MMVRQHGAPLVAALTILLAACGGAQSPAPGTTSDPARSSAAASAAPSVTPEKATIRLAHILAVNDQVAKQIDAFAEDVRKRSDGNIEVQIFPAGQLYKTEADSIAALQRGEIQMAVHTNGAFSTLVPARNILDVPFKFASWDVYHANVDGAVGALLAKATEEKGLKVLGHLDYSTIDLVGTVGKLATTPEDLKGLRLRSYSSALSEAMKGWGAAPTLMSAGDVYTALQLGTIDGLISGSGFYERKWYEVTPYLTQVPVNLSSVPVGVNLAFWNKLAPSQQKVLTDAAKASEAANRAGIAKSNADAYEKMRSSVKGWYVVPPAELPLWQNSVSALDAWYLATAGELGKQVLAAVK